jgi:hypothetical protein
MPRRFRNVSPRRRRVLGTSGAASHPSSKRCSVTRAVGFDSNPSFCWHPLAVAPTISTHHRVRAFALVCGATLLLATPQMRVVMKRHRHDAVGDLFAVVPLHVLTSLASTVLAMGLVLQSAGLPAALAILLLPAVPFYQKATRVYVALSHTSMRIRR